MQNNLIDKQLVDTTMAQCGVSNLDDASIRDTVKIANLLEKATGYNLRQKPKKYILLLIIPKAYKKIPCKSS